MERTGKTPDSDAGGDFDRVTYRRSRTGRIHLPVKVPYGYSLSNVVTMTCCKQTSSYDVVPFSKKSFSKRNLLLRIVLIVVDHHDDEKER